MTKRQTFGKRIRNLREAEPRTSLRALAEVTGISRGYLCQIENEQVPPPGEEAIEKLARALGAKPATLFALAGRVTPTVLRAFRKHPEQVERLCKAVARIRAKEIVETVIGHAEHVSRERL